MMKKGEKQIGMIHGYAWPHGRLFKTKSSHISEKKISTPSGKRCLIRRVTLQSNHPFSQVFETAARWLANAKVSQIQKLWSSEMLKKIRAKKHAKRALLKDSATSKASSIIFQGKILKYIRCLLLLWMHSIYIDLNSIYIYYIIYTCEKSTGIYKIIIITQKKSNKTDITAYTIAFGVFRVLVPPTVTPSSRRGTTLAFSSSHCSLVYNASPR